MSTEPTLSSGAATPSTVLPALRPVPQPLSRSPVQHLARRPLGHLVLLLLTALSAFPLLWMVMPSLRARNEVLGGDLLPRQITFAAYAFIWSEFHIMTFFGNSIFVTLCTIVVVVALATLA